MSAERIEFILSLDTGEEFPRPYPASKEIPEWYKSMPAECEWQGVKAGTVKNCPPFLEALTCGYMIPLVADITLARDKTGEFHGQGPVFHDRRNFGGIAKSTYMIQAHRSIQVQGSPIEQFPIVKVYNPWLIRTSPGYSTLFMAPLNRFQNYLSPLAGLVERTCYTVKSISLLS